MGKQSSVVEKQQRRAQWQDRIQRQSVSDQSVRAFCGTEGVSIPTFYWWRSRLATPKVKLGADALIKPSAAFIDLGSVRKPTVERALEPLPCSSNLDRFEIRLELGEGVVLHLARR